MTPTTSSPEDGLPDAVVTAALDAYARLPKHGKPARRDNGVAEWTVFASILLTAPSELASPSSSTSAVTPNSTHPPHSSAPPPPSPLAQRPRVIPISLATGVKCLPAARLPPLGDTLHDSHAEVLARRGFVRWLIDEAARVVRGERGEGVLELRNGAFRMKEGVEVWLYVSALPVSPP